jgi:hypothetical protein
MIYPASPINHRIHMIAVQSDPFAPQFIKHIRQAGARSHYKGREHPVRNDGRQRTRIHSIAYSTTHILALAWAVDKGWPNRY